MTDFTIRTATPEDEHAVTALTRASYSMLMEEAYGRSHLLRLLPVIGKANPGLLASGTYYLAERKGGTIIAAGGWTKEQPGTGKSLLDIGHIRHFATHPDWIGKGVGRAIMACCLDEAAAAGVRRLQCQASLNAVDFYRRLGFKPCELIDVAVGGGDGCNLLMTAMLMELMFDDARPSALVVAKTDRSPRCAEKSA